METMNYKVYIGTRKSRLALIQTEIAAKSIRECFSEARIVIRPMSTQGDRNQDQSLTSFGGKGVFTQELEEALLSGAIDMAIHSAKDMPMEFAEGTKIGAVFPRGDARDVVVTRDGTRCADLPPGAVVGTGSLRRRLQLSAAYPQLTFKDVRGNVKTRLEKLADGQYDALVLAAAGLCRLREWESAEERRWYERFHYEYLDTDVMLPAAGQAIIAAQTRKPGRFPEKDKYIEAICRAVTDKAALAQLTAERGFLKACGGSCNAPAAALAKKDPSGGLILHTVYAPDGIHPIRKTEEGRMDEAETLGRLAWDAYDHDGKEGGRSDR